MRIEDFQLVNNITSSSSLWIPEQDSFIIPLIMNESTTDRLTPSTQGPSYDSLADVMSSGEDVDQALMPYPDFTQIPLVSITFIILYFLVMVTAIFGNAAVCITVLTNRKMQTVVNYYIVNLAICDFMVGVFVLPIKLLELTAPASWGALSDGLCTAVLYTQTVIVFASVLTLVATSIERYVDNSIIAS